MRDLFQVLREKEFEIARVQNEIEALRAVIPMLDEDQDVDTHNPPYPPLRAVNQE